GIESLVLEQGTEPLAELGPLVHALDQLGARGPLDEHVVGPVRERAGQTVVLEELPDVVPHVAAPHAGVDTGLPFRADVGDAKFVEQTEQIAHATLPNNCAMVSASWVPSSQAVVVRDHSGRERA